LNSRLYKKISNKFIKLSEKQTEYLKDRVDIIDKLTGIFERTINQQEDEIKKLRTNIDENRIDASDKSVSELKLLSSEIKRIYAKQDDIINVLNDLQFKDKKIRRISDVLNIKTMSERMDFKLAIEDAIIKRDKAKFTIKCFKQEGVNDLINELKDNNYKAMILEPIRRPKIIGKPPLTSDKHEAI
jgi:hypothetical protein